LKIFGIKLLEGQLFPPARDGLDATRSVACTATTHRLAGQIHTCSGYDAWRTRVNRGVHEKNECIQPIWRIRLLLVIRSFQGTPPRPGSRKLLSL